MQTVGEIHWSEESGDEFEVKVVDWARFNCQYCDKRGCDLYEHINYIFLNNLENKVTLKTTSTECQWIKKI